MNNIMRECPRHECPRPDFERENILMLNGEWGFSYDSPVFSRKITVPFAPETPLSGINDKDFHPVVWYEKLFSLPDSMKDKDIILRFGAVDYSCDVWLNGIHIGSHEGGQTSFSFDVTNAIDEETDVQRLRVLVRDDPFDMEMPRGKQFWERDSRSIFYSRTTGIWQSVWLEGVSEHRIENFFITPLLDERSVKIEYELSTAEPSELRTLITFEGKTAADIISKTVGRSGSFTVRIDHEALGFWNFEEDMTWSPERPRLFDVQFTLTRDGIECDRVRSYFGMRKISIENGVVKLNNRPYFQKLVLDQGYWEESLMTPPSDEAIIRDIELVKAMGFNGVRKHQKAEDPRFLYHADRLGLLVWGEFGAPYVFSRKSASRTYAEWQDIIKRDYNHPCIIVWTPVNESWGVPEITRDKKQQEHANALYHMIKSLDGTRLVIDNDGWEHTCGDLLTVHDYTSDGEKLGEHFASTESVLSLTPGSKALFAEGYEYKGQPVLVTEYGGIRFAPGTATKNSWGYVDEQSADKFLMRFEALTDALKSSPVVQGCCYTQLTDIEAEENGLLRYDRTPKAPICEIKRINDK